MKPSIKPHLHHETNQQQQYCTFQIANRLYGFNIRDVKEITAEIQLTPIFHAPESVKGYVNIRGQIHMILDLQLLLGLGSHRYMETSKFVLFKQKAGESFGVMVEGVGGVINIDNNKIEWEKKDETITSEEYKACQYESDLIHGIYKLPHSLIVILRADRLLVTGKHYP